MTKTTTEQTSQSQAFDWQEDLVGEIITSDSGQWLLAATTGAGKTVAAFILLARMRERLPDARMFGAVPTSAGAGRFVERLRRWDSGGKVLLASPSWYRRRKSEYSDSEDIWGEGATYIFDSSLLQRPSAGSSLQEVSWDLGVVEDLDLLLGDSSQKDREDTRLWSTLEQLLISGQCDRLLALSREVRQPFSKPLTVVEQDLAIVEAQGVDFEQSVLEYERTEKEQDLHAELGRIEEFLAPNAKQSAGLIRRTFDAQISSFYAVDQWLYALKRLVEVSETAKSAKPVGLRTVDSEFWEGIEDLRSLWKQVDKAQLWVEALLDRMAEVETDAKFEGFKRFLVEDAPSHVCCMTFDTRTLKYLKVSLEETNISVYSLHNKLDFGERERVLDSFQEHGGVLLAIDNVLPDLALIEADVVVHYDLPMRTGSMQRRQAAVLPRDGDELPAYALRDTAGTIDGEDTLLKQYKFI